jgi:hypothetical protein
MNFLIIKKKVAYRKDRIKLLDSGFRRNDDPNNCLIINVIPGERQKKRTVSLETKDSSSADYCILKNKVRSRPPQNDRL